MSPVIQGCEHLEVVYAKDQPQYRPLPALRVDDGGTVLSRWRLTWRERLHILCTGDVYLSVRTFGAPLQPVILETRPRLVQTAGD